MKTTTMGIARRGLLPFFLLGFLLPLSAQGRLQADATVRQVSGGKRVRVEKQLFYKAGGTLVVHFTYPEEYYMVTNRLGETAVYHPKTNEAMQMETGAMDSRGEIFALFMEADGADLGLGRAGYVLRGVEHEGSDQVRTYVPSASGVGRGGRAVVVVREGKPIYLAFYAADGHMQRKCYFSKYVELPMATFPTVVTQISYSGASDSVIRKEEYRNIKTSGFGADALFDFSVPQSAKRVKPF